MNVPYVLLCIRPLQRYWGSEMQGIRQSVQSRNSMGWATEELLILAEQIVSFLPANIQTKYFMIKAELLRRAAVIGATYNTKNPSQISQKQAQNNVQMKMAAPIYISNTLQEKPNSSSDKLVKQNASKQMIENNELLSLQNVPNNAKMTIEELHSATQQKNPPLDDIEIQEYKSNQDGDITKNKNKCIGKQKYAQNTDNHNQQQINKEENQINIISLTNTAEHIQIPVVMQDAEVQTDEIQNKVKDNKTKSYEEKIQILNGQIKILQDQLEVEKMKNSEMVNIISHRTKEVANAESKTQEFQKNQQLITEVIAGLISKIGGGDGLGSGALKKKGLSELLDLLNSQINVFCGYVFETQEKLRAQVTEHNTTVSTLENQVKELQQAVEVAEEAQRSVKQDAARCIREIAQRADQHVSAVQTRLADLFRDFKKAKYAQGFRESVSKMFEVSSENNSRDQSAISRSVRSSQ